ncbi:ligase-associated DNA damage response endonuclease PdeM [Marinigracilibium pacificum]|uniref:Ligase-associated DNA damage response endonuclease PdeM n=1 Tax=Marinigracilibium pacificum TaxID=2729599 RepID=A0A848ITX5_9BACT|nr:ligase-associated DNA damage response endonuclease PdeM [Marinigracilibium pacificum]
MNKVKIDIRGEKLTLLPEKGIFWEKESALLIADLHLGKITHFRKHGVALPAGGVMNNWSRLAELIDEYQPKDVYFLGDLFHSDYNHEWTIFEELSTEFERTNFHLIAGNHDILPSFLYDKYQIKVYKEPLIVEPFIFSHHPLEEENEFYNLAGHIHPGVVMRGPGRQSIRLKCFYFSKSNGVLPSYGDFTGIYNMKVKEDDQVYVITNDTVIKV